MKAMYDLQPEKYSDNGNGSFTYRWDILQVEVSQQGGTIELKWQCNEVIVWGTVTREKIVETVIKELWGINTEAKLLNDYNAFVLGILPVEYKTRYADFLTARKIIKDQINADCATLGII